MAAKSEWHRDAAVTLTRRSRGPGLGIGTSLISSGAPRYIVSNMTSRVLYLDDDSGFHCSLSHDCFLDVVRDEPTMLPAA